VPTQVLEKSIALDGIALSVSAKQIKNKLIALQAEWQARRQKANKHNSLKFEGISVRSRRKSRKVS